jgi:hypothetical protein
LVPNVGRANFFATLDLLNWLTYWDIPGLAMPIEW